MNTLNILAKGQFKFDALRDGEMVPLTDWQDNLITNAGMDSIGMDGNPNRWGGVVVGSGTTPPQFTDTNLATFVSGANLGTWTGSVLGNVVTFTAVTTFPLGGVVANLSELGLSINGYAAGSTLATRALIRDGAGQPTTIPVQATDQLIVTYRVIFTVDQTISSQVITDPGTDIEYTVRAKYSTLLTAVQNYGIGSVAFGLPGSGATTAYVGATFGGPGEAPSGGVPQGVSSSQFTQVNDPYVPGSFSLVSGVRFGTGAVALDRDGINVVRVSAYVPAGNIDFEFDPPFRKPATSTATLKWRTSWARG